VRHADSARRQSTLGAPTGLGDQASLIASDVAARSATTAMALGHDPVAMACELRATPSEPIPARHLELAVYSIESTEVRMNIVRPLLLLAAVLIGPVHAQTCSGGAGGGIDGTGNQCNTPYEVTASTAGSATNSSVQAAKKGRVDASVSAVPLSEKMSARPSTRTVAAQPPSRMDSAAASAGAPMKAAKLETWSEAACSGGAYGGMDLNGNQCGDAVATAKVLSHADIR
jgi:hypothetical protein